jgi:hypothetical protein
MRGIPLFLLTIVGCAVAGVTGLASADTLGVTPTVRVFEVHLQEAPCGTGGAMLCGAGEMAGFGRVKAREEVRMGNAPLASGCFVGVGTRTLTLAREPKSILRLAVRGEICFSLLRGWGTFKVSSGRGAFAGATGSGVILDSMTPGQTPGHGSLHLFGVLTLGRK